jgi:plastocyanin
MMCNLTVRSCAIVPVLLLAACSGPKTQSENAPPKSEPANSVAAVEDANAGSISGKVSLTGDAPVMKTIDMSATPACAKEHPTPQKSEEVVVNGNHTLKYVFVWVKSGVPERTWPTPKTPAVLDQIGCMYEPHVIGVMVNQDVKYGNSDPTNHNIHPLPRLNAEWNESEAPKASDVVKHFTKQEVMVPVKCNIHPWMRAYIGVVSHPFFAVTDDSGTFKIKGLPPGQYTLEAWHERFGRKEVQVTVGPKEEKTVDFEFSAKS